jgi:hypothetical protein
VPPSQTNDPQWSAVAGIVHAPLESRSEPLSPAQGNPLSPVTVPSQKQALGPSLQTVGRGVHVPARPFPHRPSTKLQYSVLAHAALVVQATGPGAGAQRIVVLLQPVAVTQILCGHEATSIAPGPQTGAQLASLVQSVVFPHSSTS